MNSTNDYDENNFFDSFPVFYQTSKTSAEANRLNHRYTALIHSNKEIIKNSSILDLGSHDGRWSFAAIKSGAKRVLGIEGREELVKVSFETMEKYRIPREKYSFEVGDIFEKIKEIKPNEFDVVFCFGIFYHIMNHMLLLHEIKRLRARYLILDTKITTSKKPTIHIRQENSQDEGMGIPDSSQIDNHVLAGRPSKSSVEIMLNSLGFNFYYYDWLNSGIKNWKNLEDYQLKNRVPLNSAVRYGFSVIKDFKNKRKTFRSDIAQTRSGRITIVAKNQY